MARHVEDTGHQSVIGVERALDVLSLFAKTDSPTLGVTEIANALQLSKAVVHRMLAAARTKGFVEIDQPSRRYRLGPESLYLGLAYLERVEVRAIAKGALEELVAATNETATLSVRVGWSRVYLDQVNPDRDVKMVVQLGKPFALHTGASSKALLAFLPKDEREKYLLEHELVALTPLSITDRNVLRQELDWIRAKGFAVSFGERDPSAAAVAAPVFDHESSVAAVISVSGPVERFKAEIDASLKLLLRATRRVSGLLGYDGGRDHRSNRGSDQFQMGPTDGASSPRRRRRPKQTDVDD